MMKLFEISPLNKSLDKAAFLCQFLEIVDEPNNNMLHDLILNAIPKVFILKNQHEVAMLF